MLLEGSKRFIEADSFLIGIKAVYEHMIYVCIMRYEDWFNALHCICVSKWNVIISHLFGIEL